MAENEKLRIRNIKRSLKEEIITTIKLKRMFKYRLQLTILCLLRGGVWVVVTDI